MWIQVCSFVVNYFVATSASICIVGGVKQARKVSFREGNLEESTVIEDHSTDHDDSQSSYPSPSAATQSSFNPTHYNNDDADTEDNDYTPVLSVLHTASAPFGATAEPMQRQQRPQSTPTMTTQGRSAQPSRPMSAVDKIQDWSWLLGPATVYREDDLAAVKYTSERVGEHRASLREKKKRDSSSSIGSSSQKGENNEAGKDNRSRMLRKRDKDHNQASIAAAPSINLEISDDEGTEG